MYPPFNFFGQVTSQQMKQYITLGNATFKTFVNQQATIRCFIQGAPAFGHQSASVNIIRRFCEASGGIEFGGTIEVFLDNYDEDIVKIRQLIPELNNTNQGAINSATIHVYDMIVDSPDTDVRFGFTGACDWINDHPHLGFLESAFDDLRVTSFLMLQPYKWEVKLYAQGGLTPGNIIFYKKNHNKYALNLDSGDLMNVTNQLGSPKIYPVVNNFDLMPPLHIKDRSFLLEIPDISTANWDTIINATNVQNEKHLLRILKALTTPASIQKYNIVPIYGINHPNATHFRKPLSGRIALIMSAMQTALRNGALPTIKPPIVINFSPYDPGQDQVLSFNNILRLASGGATAFEQNIQTVGAGPHLAVNPTYYNNLISRLQARKRSMSPGYDSAYRIENYIDIDNLPGLLTWLDGKLDRVLFIQADRVRPNVFNYILKSIGLLPIFEGQNTAVPSVMTGKPYFHIEGANHVGSSNNYLPGTVGQKDAAQLTVYLQLVANQIQEELDEWPINFDLAPTKIISDFITNSYTDHDVVNYFKSVQEYFQDIVNDKINIGTAIFANYSNVIFGVGDSASLEESQNTILDTLYNELKKLVDDKKSIDLLNVIITKGTINEYLKALLKLSGGKLIITEGDVLKKGNITNVILTGNTDAFGLSTSCSFNFSVDNDKLSCQAAFTSIQPWSLDGVPWIVFEKPTFQVMVSDGGLPPTGSFDVTVKDTGIKLALSLPDHTGIAKGSATFDTPASISNFLALVGGINLEGMVPEPIQKLANVGVKYLAFSYNSKVGAMESITVQIGSPDNWTILPNLEIQDANVKIDVLNPGDLKNRKTTASLSGNMAIGPIGNQSVIKVSAKIPGLRLSGQLSSPSLPLDNLLGIFWPGVSLPWPGGSDPKLTELSINYDTTNKDYLVDTTLDLQWPIKVAGTTILTIEYISLYLTGSDNWNLGTLSGSILILPNSKKIGLLLSAQYLGKNNGWKFSGQQTSGSIGLLELFTFYLPANWKPDSQFDILIDGLALEIETKSSSWKFQCKTAQPIQIPGIDLSLDMSLKLGYNSGTTSSSYGGRESIVGKAVVPTIEHDYKYDLNNPVELLEYAELAAEKKGYFGTAQADITWENIEITVIYDFKPDYKSFGIKWGSLEGKIEKTGSPPETIATIEFTKSATLGSIVETMIGWATGSNFGLQAPWNILNSIPLNGLKLEFNFTKKTVAITYPIGPIDIGVLGINVATIDHISVEYSKESGVQVKLEGTFLWQQNTKEPLGWDATKPETTPGPPAMGNKYVDIRMLAMGQHVEIAGLTSADSVGKAIEIMKNLPDPEPGKIPPITLNPNNGWMVGMDIGLLRIEPPKSGSTPPGELQVLSAPPATTGGYVFNMQLVFSDPNLYGLAIALDGDAAKIFKGLKFEIMYRKVSENVGVYQAEIALPDAMRYIKMGQFNITLPVFGIEIYTNSDFKVDLGFPWNSDFSRSFTFQTIIYAIVPIPVTGSIGIYFGKLSSETSTSVPVPTNPGIFNPVIVFGVGVNFGLGYDFDAGILKAGFKLVAVAIIEGIIAKWNAYPTDPNQQTPSKDRLEDGYYFALRGTIGLIGKLYGSVDFAIVKASIDIEINIMAEFYFAPYEPIELSIRASVRATASLKIDLGLFSITIHFSFSVEVQQHVTLPAIGSNPPWGQVQHSGSGLHRMYAKQRAHRLAHVLSLHALKTVMTPQWDNLVAVSPPQNLKTYLTLGLTAAQDENQGTNPTLDHQKACYISMLMIESVKGPQLDTTSARLKAGGLDGATDTAFEILGKQILRWVIAAAGTQKVTAEEIDDTAVSFETLTTILHYLSDDSHPNPIPYSGIQQFMSEQFVMEVNPPKDNSGAPIIDVTAFPMVPSIELKIPAYQGNPELKYTFDSYNSISQDYLNDLRKYFDELAIKAEDKDVKMYDSDKLEALANTSVADFVFSDYFALIARQMVQMAINTLKNYAYEIKPGDKPESIVTWINDQIHPHAASVSPSNVPQTYTVEHLFENNESHLLNEGKTLSISGVTYPVQSGKTFSNINENNKFGALTPKNIAEANADTKQLIAAGIEIHFTVVVSPATTKYTTQPGDTLNDIAKAFSIGISDLLDNSNVLGAANLLLPSATLTIPDFDYPTGSGDTLMNIANDYGTSVQQLSQPAKNAQVTDLFSNASTDDKDLNIVQLPQFKTGELITEIQRTQGLQNLAGLTSRYYMAGLRLPTNQKSSPPGITPNYKGIWVTDNAGQLTLPDIAGLYALTGQQFEIPTIAASEPFEVQFSSSLSWVQMISPPVGSPPVQENQITISITSGSKEANQISKLQSFATTKPLNTGLTELGSQEIFKEQPATYTFHSAVPWVSPSKVLMPYSFSPDHQEVQDLKFWKLPEALAKLPDLNKHNINPEMDVKLGTYNQATQSVESKPMNNYGFGTRVEFTIKKVTEISSSPATKTTYEVLGADGENVALLEDILSQVKDESGISSIRMAYSQTQKETGNAPLQTDNTANLTFGLSQVNLSTDTHPDSGFGLEYQMLNATEGILLNASSLELIRLLWQAGITRAGGYYLYYYDSDTKKGLPDHIFNSEGEAKISLLIIYSDNSNLITNYVNFVVTSEGIDFSRHTLFAESVSQKCTIPPDATNIADLITKYYASIGQITDAIKSIPMPDTTELVVEEGFYQVGLNAPAGNLANIIAHFHITEQELKDANPQINNWSADLPLFTSIFLPKVNLKISTSPAGNTLEAIARFYGLTPIYLVGQNQYVDGLVTNAKGTEFQSGPMDIKSSLPQGVAGVKAKRPVPDPIPDDPDATDYAEIYLKNNFSLLAYKVHENGFFRSSNYGLPMNPGTSKESKAHSHGKFGTPPILKAGVDDWEYDVALPYNKFAKEIITSPGLNVSPPKISPYDGVGDLFQVHFEWQDIYGNRIMSVLDNPVPTSRLNDPTILTRYTDEIVGLSQWPSVSSSYLVDMASPGPELNITLNFDPTVYDGLWSAEIEKSTPNTIKAVFTNDLDQTSAENIKNYTINDDNQITAVTLKTNNTVWITVSRLTMVDSLSLQVKNIKATNEQIFEGSATFTNDGFVTSTLKNHLLANLATYELLWFQLNDPLGIELYVTTTLVEPQTLVLDPHQFDTIVNTWLNGIYEFVEQRSKGNLSTTVSMKDLPLSFSLEGKTINPSDIFKLETSFAISRVRKDLVGDFAYANNLASASTQIPPDSKTGTKDEQNLKNFADKFESALSTSEYLLSVAHGTDRFDQNGTSKGTLWVTRVLISGNKGIGFSIEASPAEEPQLFAPKPVSNSLFTQFGLEICPYTEKGLECTSPPERKDFVNIDLGLWCMQLFENFDSILTPTYTASIQLVDKIKKTGFMAELLGNKESFAHILKYLMVPVFEADLANDPSVVQERFKQNLLIKLSNTYTVQAGIQYTADVNANIIPTGQRNAWNEVVSPAVLIYPPRLYGNVSIPQDSPPAATGKYSNLTFTSPKLTLENTQGSQLAFLMSSPDIVRGEDKQVLPFLELDLEYVGSNIEHQIGVLDNIQGYQASSWLKFDSNKSSQYLSAALPTAKVPLPLKSFPTTPRLSAQTGALTNDTAINQLLQWDYTIVYNQSFHFPQDILQFEVKSNVKKGFEMNDMLDPNPIPDLRKAFNEIAQLITVYPDMEGDLAVLAEIDASTPIGSELFTKASTVLTAYNKMLTDIVTAAEAPTSRSNEDMLGVASETYNFDLQEGSKNIESEPDALLITVKNLPPTGFGELTVEIDGYVTHQLPADKCASNTSCFYFKENVSPPPANPLKASQGQTIPERKIKLIGLNILDKQDLETSVAIERNAILVPGKPTNKEFVFTTGQVKFANLYYPNFVHSHSVDIAKLENTSPPAILTLEEHLDRLFKVLLEQNSQTELSFSIVTEYSYEINSLGNRVSLPIMMQPMKTFTLADPQMAPAEMIKLWVDNLNQWMKDNQPETNGGRYNFNLTIFSNLTLEPKPLIQISDLYLLLADIS